MKYEIMLYTGYIGLCISMLLCVLLFFKLDIWKCIMQIIGLDYKKTVNELQVPFKEKKLITKNKTTELLEKAAQDAQATQDAMDETCLLENEEIEDTNILNEEKAMIFHVTKSVLIVHTDQSIETCGL